MNRPLTRGARIMTAHLQTLQTLLYDERDQVATVTLNRPERLNSFNDLMHEEWRAVLQHVRSARAAGAVRALVITGAGRGFCAGQDLSDRKRAPGAPPRDLGLSMANNYGPLILALRALPLPVIAAVNGVAAGAGANLALACDLVYAARSAAFIESFTKVGLIPDTGGSWVLPRLIGPARAMGYALFADKIGAEKAEQMGLIWKCVDDAELMDTVRAAAVQLAAGPTVAYANTKRAIWASSTNDFAAQIDLETELIRACGYTDDYAEGVAAFGAKRVPEFKGK